MHILPQNVSSVPWQAGVWGVVGKQGAKASGSLSSLWTLPLRGNISVEASKLSHTLQISTTYGRQNVSFAAALNTADKVGGDTGLCLWTGSVEC